jgi:hypothetical protein
VVGLLFLAILVFGGISLLHGGIYGWTIFIVAPVFLGGIASWVFRPATAAGAVELGGLTVTIATFSLVIFKLEGMFCIMMALPLALTLGILGSWLVYRAEPSKLAKRRWIDRTTFSAR